jgi:hypothetical protein
MERARKEPHCAGERSQHACDRAPWRTCAKARRTCAGRTIAQVCERAHSGSINPAGAWTAEFGNFQVSKMKEETNQRPGLGFEGS